MLTEQIDLAADGSAQSTELVTLPPPERAAIALNTTKTETELKALAVKHAGIVEIKDKAGRDQAHGAYMELLKTRTGLAAKAKEIREDATKFSTAVVAEEKRLIALVEPEEKRIKTLRDNWDADEAQREKERKEKEQKRLAEIQAQLEQLQAYPKLADEARTSKALTSMLERMGTKWNAIDWAAVFQEKEAIAREVYAKSIAAVTKRRDTLDAAERAKAEQDAEAQRLADKAAELANRQAELDAREAAFIQREKAAQAPAAEPEQKPADEQPAPPVVTGIDMASGPDISTLDQPDIFGVGVAELRQPEEKRKNEQASGALQRVASLETTGATRAQTTSAHTWSGGGARPAAMEAPPADRILTALATYFMTNKRQAAAWVIERFEEIKTLHGTPPNA